MGEEGNVHRETVIKVLRLQGVGVSKQVDGPSNMFVLAKGERLEALELPQAVGRQMIHYLARHYDVPIHYFYHPEMAANPVTDKIQ